MKPRSVVVLSAAVLLLSGLAGCATTPRTAGPFDNDAEVSVNINGLPQTVLAGATVENARALTMGLARTKGWEIRQAAANQVVLERPLRADAPQLAALGGGSSLAAPKRLVETNLVNGAGGAIVALRYFVVANPGTPDEHRADVTGQSQAEIDASFRSLQRAWAQDRGRIVAPLPLPTQEQVAARSEDAAAGTNADTNAGTSAGAGTGGPALAARATPSTAVAASATTAPPSPPATPPGTPVAARQSAPAPTPTPLPARAPAAAPPAAATVARVRTRTPGPSGMAAAPRGRAPILSTAATGSGPAALVPAAGSAAGPAGSAVSVPRPAPTPGLPSSSPPVRSATTIGAGGVARAPGTVGTAPAGRNDMLALNAGQDRKGLWAYYAEDYAHLRGCQVAARGAVLLTETNGAEVHEVHCDGGPNFLMRCQGGACQEMR